MRGRAWLACWCLLGLASCAFLRPVDSGPRGLTHDELTRLIDEAAAAGLSRAELADLYARRSASRVRHNPAGSVSMTLLSFWTEEPLHVPFFLLGVVVAPVEIVVSPIQFGWLAIEDLRVSEEHVEAALRDLAKARELGYTADRARGLMWSPTWAERHLDQLDR